MLTVDIRDVARRDWIEASIRFAANELAAGRASSDDLVSRLSEALLIEAVRQHVARGEGGGWFAGARDPQIGRAIAAIHRDLAAPLTVEALASEAAMSRSAFVERFRALLGQPPMQYVAARRFEAARLRLRETADSIADVAHDLGYGSEEAFSRALRREHGMPPGRWRQGATAA